MEVSRRSMVAPQPILIIACGALSKEIATLVRVNRWDIVMVGGAPLNEEFGAAVGADAYCRDAADAATTAIRLVTERRELKMIA